MVYLKIKQSTIKNAGRGVFSTKAFKKGEVIEKCPMLVIGQKHTEPICKTGLQYYLFSHPDNKQTILALGYGSLYNHHELPNALYEMDTDDMILCIKARTYIRKGKEIFINYGGYYGAKYDLWWTY